MKYRSAIFATLAVLPLGLSACQGTLLESTRRNVTYTEIERGPLEQLSPSDVAVVQVRNHTGRENVPLRALRSECDEMLVNRLYSPLEAIWVDTHIEEAAVDLTRLGADALLQVTITNWDDDSADYTYEVVVEGEFRLLDSQNPGAESLWGLRIGRRIDLSGERVKYPTDSQLMERAAELFVEEALTQLPERNPRL